MKVFRTVMKIIAALAVVAGLIYVAATYGDKIVAWAKRFWIRLKSFCCDSVCCCDEDCCCGDECCCSDEECCCEEEAAPAEEAPAQAEEADFEG